MIEQDMTKGVVKLISNVKGLKLEFICKVLEVEEIWFDCKSFTYDGAQVIIQADDYVSASSIINPVIGEFLVGNGGLINLMDLPNDHPMFDFFIKQHSFAGVIKIPNTVEQIKVGDYFLVPEYTDGSTSVEWFGVGRNAKDHNSSLIVKYHDSKLKPKNPGDPVGRKPGGVYSYDIPHTQIHSIFTALLGADSVGQTMDAIKKMCKDRGWDCYRLDSFLEPDDNDPTKSITHTSWTKVG